MAELRDRRNRSWSPEDLCPACAGLLMALSFPPISLSFLAFLAIVPLFLYLDHPFTLARIARAGVFCTIVYFGIVLSWLMAVGTFSWLAFPAYVAVLILHICNFFFFVIAVAALKSYLSLPFVCTAPFAWVVCERLRAYGDLSFPWTPFAYSLTPFPFLLQCADLVGVYGVSFWLVLLNALLYEAFRARRRPAARRMYLALWLAAFLVVVVYDAARWLIGTEAPSGHLEVAVIQPNIPQRIRWDERYRRQILEKIFAMDAGATRDSTDLVVWPETGIPYYIDESRPFRLTEMGNLPRKKAYILTGLLESNQDGGGQTHYYNIAGLFDPRGAMLGQYKKMYLVPGSERYPFRQVLGFTRAFLNIQNVSYGLMDPGDDATVFTLPRARFSVLICYESAVPDLSRAFRVHGAQVLVNITNDAWFGRSFAPYQHASFLVMRAIENRTAIVRCGNTGISGFVDPLGRWRQKTALFTEAAVSERVPLTSELTFYTQFGDLVVHVSYVILSLLLLFALKKKYSAKSERSEQ